jgi:hypothetical protein
MTKLPPHQRHSDTSVAAAKAVAPKFGKQTMSVLEVITKAKQGMTDLEGQEHMQMSGDSYRPCRVELTKKGYIEDSMERRLTKSKRKAVVWRVTDVGRNVMSPQLTLNFEEQL